MYVTHNNLDLSSDIISSVRFNEKTLKGLNVSYDGARDIASMLGVIVK